MGLSVVVPVYNAAASLPTLVCELHPVLAALGTAYELVLVNDGSADGSWDVIQELASRHPWIRGFSLMRNYGQHNALLCGIREAQHDVIVTMDDDLQHPPAEIPKLLAMLDAGYDVVYGTPDQEHHDWPRRLASRLTKRALQTVMGVEAARHASAFRAFRTELRKAFPEYRSPFVSIDVLLSWGSARFAAVSVRHEPRRVGTSNYTFRMLVVHAVNMISGYSALPLRLASVVGFGMTLFGVGVLVLVVGRYLLLGSSVPGFAFLASIIAMFSGTQLFALGIMGEYLARMHFRSMERPVYTVRESTNSP